MNAATKTALILSMTLAAAGCAASHHEAESPTLYDAPASAEAAASDGWVSGPADLRKLTVLVKVTPPPQLRELFVRASAVTRDPDMSAFFKTFADGGSGSGFIMVRRHQGKDHAFVVTNRHVVEQAETVDVVLSDGAAFTRCDIVHTDDENDLAVLAFPQGQRPVPYGLRPAAAPPRDRQTVVATGFPGLVDEPSYQTTEGKISNVSFTLETEGRKNAYIQHTAPIDPGSSGGPLTSEDGELLGVNTMLLRNRHSAFFAVPADAVTRAVDKALEIELNRAAAPWKKERLVEACQVLTGELGSRNPKYGLVAGMISNNLVARAGVQSFLEVMEVDGIISLFTSDPMTGMRVAILAKLMAMAQSGGGMVSSSSCASFVASDLVNIANTSTVRQQVEAGRQRMELTWTFEHGHWRVADASL